jgi:hypothetical protein
MAISDTLYNCGRVENDVECCIKFTFAKWFLQIVSKISEALGWQIPSILLGLS